MTVPFGMSGVSEVVPEGKHARSDDSRLEDRFLEELSALLKHSFRNSLKGSGMYMTRTHQLTPKRSNS